MITPRFSKKHAQARRLARGFTLLETIMVLMLLAVLTLLIASAFGVTRRADVRTSHWNQSLEHMDAAQSYLRRALMRARPVAMGSLVGSTITSTPRSTFGNDANGSAVFTGDATQMSFLAPAPMVQESSGPKYNDLRIKRMGDQRWLVLQLAALAPDGALQPWGEEQILSGPIRDGHFAYQGLDAQGKPTTWLTRWPWPNRLPRIVRIQLDETRGLPWQTMTVPLLLQSVDQQGGGT